MHVHGAEAALRRAVAADSLHLARLARQILIANNAGHADAVGEFAGILDAQAMDVEPLGDPSAPPEPTATAN